MYLPSTMESLKQPEKDHFQMHENIDIKSK